ncbi:MAG: pilin [bacterium]|nr:pilin [bacterium]
MRANVLWMALVSLLLPLAVRADATASESTLKNPLGDKVDSIPVLIGTIIRAGFGIIGSVALVMFLWGGFVWLTSQGESGKITKGRDTMVWAAIGIVAMFAAYALTDFVITKLGASGAGVAP